MKYLLRPDRRIGTLGFVALVGLGAFLAAAPARTHGQAPTTVRLLSDSFPFIDHSAEPGYLGVEIVDVDPDKAQALKLKDTHGALIILVDHDAPAGQLGLRVNDVILGLNGQPVARALDLGKMIHGLRPGARISLLVSREGNTQTMATALADRRAMEQAIWGQIGPGGDSGATPQGGMGILPGGELHTPGGFHMSLFAGNLKVGAMVEPLTSQMADFLGVKNGLMVKQVEHKSEAEAAGLRAFDVILKVGDDGIATSADWDRALRSSVGKPVQITILRDKKQQTLTMQVDSKHRGALQRENGAGAGEESLFAGLDAALGPDFAENLSADVQAAADAARQQADEVRESMKDFKIDPQSIAEFRKEMDALKGRMLEFTAQVQGRFV